MESQQYDHGFDSETGHYLPRTMRTASRDPIPNRQQINRDYKERTGRDWQIDCQDQQGQMWSLFTPSRLPYSVVSSSFQASVRENRVESIFPLVIDF